MIKFKQENSIDMIREILIKTILNKLISHGIIFKKRISWDPKIS